MRTKWRDGRRKQNRAVPTTVQKSLARRGTEIMPTIDQVTVPLFLYFRGSGIFRNAAISFNSSADTDFAIMAICLP